MRIIVPNNNINERKYIIDILLGEFLGLEYEIEIKNLQNYEIILENGNKLIVEDYFFNKFLKDLEYLDEKNIPKKVKLGKNKFIVENDIPIIYGNDKIEEKENQIICGIDIFASSFFMLSRWEEYVNKTRDNHNRFPAYASIGYKNNFLDRPVVNEYVEMLWNMLKKLGIKQERKKREFEFVLTHDVDHIYRYKNFEYIIKILGADLLKRFSFKEFIFNIKNIIQKKDPYDTYNFLMDISEELNTKSYFFLHSSSSAKQDVNNDKYLKKIVNKIQKRGHYIGYHPSYNAYNNFNIFKKDKEKIENIIEKKLFFGRGHYLRFEVPLTWQIWEDSNMNWDSTLGYADKEGFRCGVCYSYNVFNFLTRNRLNLKEIPLLIMDVTLNSKLQNTFLIKNKVRKYKGKFVILWHNSSFNTFFWRRRNFYKEILNG